MSEDCSCKNKKTQRSSFVRTPLAYGLAMIEVAIAALVMTCKSYFIALASAATKDPDSSYPAACKTRRERFLWSLGFFTGFALAAIIASFGVLAVIWVVANP